MQYKELLDIAIGVRSSYERLEMKKFGKTWTPEQLMQGFVGDVGDLIKLVMAKEGWRSIEGVDDKLRHELADCLWSVLILADKYHVDLEQAFTENMADLKSHVERQIEEIE